MPIEVQLEGICSHEHCKARRVERTLDRIEHFVGYLVLYVAVPLLPLGLEKLYKGSTSDSGLVLTAAMYAMGLTRSSQRFLIMILGMVAGLVFSVVYGASAFGQATVPPLMVKSAEWAIVLAALAALVERGVRHLLEGERAFVYRGR